MKATRYVGLAFVLVGILGAMAVAGDSPPTVLNARRLAAIQAKHPGIGKDPLTTGSSSTPITNGTTSYFNAVSAFVAIPPLFKGFITIRKLSGNAFDPGNTGLLFLSGLDVSVVFFDSTMTVIPITLIAGAAAPNSNLFTAGYSVSSPKTVSFRIGNFGLAGLKQPRFVAVLVEGDVTNTKLGAGSLPVDAAVTGIIF